MVKVENLREEPRIATKSKPPTLFTAEEWHWLAGYLHWAECALHTVQLLCEGLSNKQIAKRLNCGVDNVSKHLGQVYDSMGVHGRVAVALKLLQIYKENLANQAEPPL